MDETPLKRLWAEERRLEREWRLVAWREDWPQAARIRARYNANFSELFILCLALGIIRPLKSLDRKGALSYSEAAKTNGALPDLRRDVERGVFI